MTQFKKIIAVKVGWCETYNGDVPRGAHGYLTDGNVGHETFNFKKYNNQYYGYIPPKAVIEKDDKKGWLVAMFALKDGKGPLCLVGWYENATITSNPTIRPEYSKVRDFPLDTNNEKFEYHFKSKIAICLPIDGRDFFPNLKLSKPRLGTAKVVYLRGHNQTLRATKNNSKSNEWREHLAALVEQYIHDYEPYKEIENKLIPPESKSSHNIVPPDEKKKKAIEKSAINKARIMLKEKGFNIINSREHERGIGYDLQAICRETGGRYKEWHVEVKGTSLDRGRFFMTRNEYDTAESDTDWRLILVEKALKPKPRVRCFTWIEAKKLFDIEPLSWYAEEIH
jgi:hypothetical protein